MASKNRVPAKTGWYNLDTDAPHLIGSCCKGCGTYAFPVETVFCKNPACDSEEFEQVPLSTEGTIWSYTNACYAPPPPYVPVTDPYEPFALAAVKLEEENLIVLGQLVPGTTIDGIAIGDSVRVVLDTLYEDDEHEYIVWRWQPLKGADNGKK